MTEVLHSPSHFPSSPTPPSSSFVGGEHCCSDDAGVAGCDGGGEDVNKEIEREKNCRDQQQLSLLALIVTLFRKSWVGCKTDTEDLCSMEIGWPTNVRHVAHVTFDRFNGFLGLPAEFEPEVPRRPPSASTTVFGVSTESMQLSYDTRGNSVPTILLLMQRHLYAEGGLQAEGIFRINGENSQEEYVRDQLNRGVVPEGIDVHCLAGLIKAWFRELPTGVLDSLSPEQVMQCQSEDECAELVKLLPPAEAALLNWAINLMADVAQMERLNKMNARNIAMVFAPNMTQMADPLTALMYAVQVMNFLKTLIERTLKDREDTIIDSALVSYPEPSDESGHQSPSVRFQENDLESEEMEQIFATEDPVFDSSPANSYIDDLPKGQSLLRSVANPASGDTHHINQMEANEVDKTPSIGVQTHFHRHRNGQTTNSNSKRGPRLINGVTEPIEKIKGISNLTRVDLAFERIEAWR